jgi:hypothetical protein
MTKLADVAREELCDCNGTPLEFGQVVQLAGSGALDLKLWALCGVVIDALEPDVDEDRYGRPVGVPPRVIVRFFDGCEDAFSAMPERRAWYEEGDPLLCEDLRIVPYAWVLWPARAWWWLKRKLERTS